MINIDKYKRNYCNYEKKSIKVIKNMIAQQLFSDDYNQRGLARAECLRI